MTEPESPFEDIPVVRVARPSDAQRIKGATVVIVTVLVVLIAKPWGVPIPRQRPSATVAIASASVTPVATPIPTIRPDGARVYDPGLFGRFSVAPGWALWPTLYVYRFGLSGPMSIDDGAGRAGASPGAPTTAPTSAPRASPPPTPPPGAGQLVDIGSADLLMVVGLDTPAETRILDARLWRFPPEGAPVRVALVELPPPWPVTYFHVYGLRVANDDQPDLVAAWTAGVYRLDLSVDPGAQVRRIGLLVRPSIGSGPIVTPLATPTP